jgi:branched-chain amino acid transport system ATP-binding protein
VTELVTDLALELRAVRAAYGTIEVLHGVDLAIPFGGLVALLGPNGAGKSTTLRVIAGQLPLTDGDVFVAGRRVNGAAPDELARHGVCLIPEGKGIFPNLTVRENLWMATHSGTSLRDIEEVAYSRFSRLGERRRQLARRARLAQPTACVVEAFGGRLAIHDTSSLDDGPKLVQ